MAVLVIAEHDNAALKSATYNTVTAALQLGGDVHVLVAGNACAGVAAEAATISGRSVVTALIDGVARYSAKLRMNLVR